MMNSDQIVKNEIYYNVSMLISELYTDNCDELCEVISKADYRTATEDHSDIDEMIEYAWDVYNSEISELDDSELIDIADRFNVEPYFNEALEHWIISDWLAEKLERHGEMIIRDFKGLTIWGRTISGQHISLDYVIQEIAEEV